MADSAEADSSRPAEPAGRDRRWPVGVWVVVLSLAVAVAAWRLCQGDGPANLLMPSRQADWVLYPSVFEIYTHARVGWTAEFRRGFEVQSVPATARGSVLANSRCRILLNNQPVPLAGSDDQGWATRATFDLAPLLVEGPNVLRVEVSRQGGPPALRLAASVNGQSVNTDKRWESSLLGAQWRPVRLASEPMRLGQGHPLGVGERLVETGVAPWRTVGLSATITALALAGLAAWRRRRTGAAVAPWVGWVPVLIAAACWIGLTGWNALWLDGPIGYDADAHAEYVQYILDHGAIPPINHGVEAHQPPAFYLLASASLNLLNLDAQSDAGAAALRWMHCAIMLVGIVAAHLCLRQIFRDRPIAVAGGTFLYAFLPMHLYMAQYNSNDLLAGVLGTVAVLLAMVVVQSSRPRVGLYAMLGAAMGVGVLSKFTMLPPAAALGAVVVIAAAVRWNLAAACRAASITLGVMLAVCGWFFVRNWLAYGSALIGSWDPRTGFAWWQYPGYVEPWQFLRYGTVLQSPFVSAMVSGIPDGLYATCWGDGGCGGRMTLAARPPWNYPLMTVGYGLALVPSILAGIGTLATLRDVVRKPRVAQVLLTSVAMAGVAGFVLQYARCPYYWSIKAFYLLPLAVVLAAMVGRGLDALSRRWPPAAWLCALLLGTWALTAMASFTVAPGSAIYHVNQCQRALASGHAEQAWASAAAAIEADPQGYLPNVMAARAAVAGNRWAEAESFFTTALRRNPIGSDAVTGLAELLLKQGRTADAAALLQAAVRDGVEAPAPFATLGRILLQQGQLEQAQAVLRSALRLSPEQTMVHTLLADTLMRQRRSSEAIAHYQWALTFDGKSIGALSGLAWVLATHPESPGDSHRALELARQAHDLDPQKSLHIERALAAALARAGNFAPALEIITILQRTLPPDAPPHLIAQLQAEQQCYAAGQPFRSQTDLRDMGGQD